MSMGAPDFGRILTTLQNRNVQFVVIGGIAGIYHGSARVTFDIDICHSRERANLEALAQALVDLNARLRGAPDNMPFKLDWQTLKSGLNFTFMTDAGDVDTLGEVSGVGGFDQCKAGAKIGKVAGIEVMILSLDNLISAKKAAGRKKDLDDVTQLEALKTLLNRRGEKGN
jgi:hypothetical protein